MASPAAEQRRAKLQFPRARHPAVQNCVASLPPIIKMGGALGARRDDDLLPCEPLVSEQLGGHAASVGDLAIMVAAQKAKQLNDAVAVPRGEGRAH
jgi:hypothetical protein